jgi:CheY-like chemotaxis protein
LVQAGRERQLVLVIEDDPNDREIYGRILGYNGFDVVFADGAAAGLERARTRQPDLVLLDVGLPDASGLDVCESLRSDPDTSGIPIIVLSAFPESRIGERARALGCADYIEKPTSPLGVLHRIEQMIGKAPLPGVGTPPVIEDPAG